MTRRYAKRRAKPVVHPAPEQKRILLELNAAIWASDCPYCGAIAGASCRQKPRGAHPPTATSTAHMDRVRAGHARLKATSK
jgi:hypothetical protein